MLHCAKHKFDFDEHDGCRLCNTAGTKKLKADSRPDNPPAPPAPLTGGKLAGDHYYRVRVIEPISPEVQPYTAECADIIEALGMTFNEGEAFKAIWRLAAARQGRGKPGNKPQYDADKAAHYGARIAAQTKRALP